MLYWIMGRSAHSRNRRLVMEDGTLRTAPVDPQLVSDASLIIYDAMLELPGIYLVSNGEQTRTLYETLSPHGTFETAMARCQREPDAPHYTPRISAMLSLTPPQVTLSILKANPLDPACTDRYIYRPAYPCRAWGLVLPRIVATATPCRALPASPCSCPVPGARRTCSTRTGRPLMPTTASRSPSSTFQPRVAWGASWCGIAMTRYTMKAVLARPPWLSETARHR